MMMIQFVQRFSHSEQMRGKKLRQTFCLIRTPINFSEGKNGLFFERCSSLVGSSFAFGLKERIFVEILTPVNFEYDLDQLSVLVALGELLGACRTIH